MGLFLFASLFIGIFSALSSSSFLYALNFITEQRIQNHSLIWGLPFLGLFLTYSQKNLSSDAHLGVSQVLKSYKSHRLLAPVVWLFSLGTHLFGGSAGREGVGVLMGVSSVAWLEKKIVSLKAHHKLLVMGAMAAGFSAIFATPIAAIVFSIELNKVRRKNEIFFIILCSAWAYLSSHILGPKHFSKSFAFVWNKEIFFYVLVAMITSGVGGKFYYIIHCFFKRRFSRIKNKYLLTFFVGAMISMTVYLTKAYPYIGIGGHEIHFMFEDSVYFYDFFMKALLTALTLSIGHKGGEVTPLFFMGASLSNALASKLNLLNYSLSSSLGMMGLFGAASATPFASAIMGAEIFGPWIGLLCLPVCLGARLFMGRRSVYHD